MEAHEKGESMLKKRIVAGVCLFAIASLLHAEGGTEERIQMFPQPKAGVERYVVEVPKLENENDHKIELIVGKTMLVDCNLHLLSGELEEHTLQGWGYTYLEAEDMNGMRTVTRKVCHGPKQEKFVSLVPDDERFRRYNSRLPVVVYVPKGYEVRYRIWSAGEEMQQAKKR